jgi:hypothetical protein
MGTFLLVLSIIGAIIVALAQGGWNPVINVGSSAQKGGAISSIVSMVKGGKRNKSKK